MAEKMQIAKREKWDREATKKKTEKNEMKKSKQKWNFK